MSGDANAAVRLKEEADSKRGFDSESDTASQAGGDEPGADPPSAHTDTPTTQTPDDDAGEDVDAMPKGDKPRPAHG